MWSSNHWAMDRRPSVATFVADCPRCRTSKIAFDVRGQNYRVTQYGWQNWWEIFCVCPNCSKATIFVVAASTDGDFEMRKLPPLQIEKISLNQIFRYEGYISLKDTSSISPPEFVEGPLLQAFVEGSTCMTVQCWNAAGTMFRLCVDIVTSTFATTRRCLGWSKQKATSRPWSAPTVVVRKEATSDGSLPTVPMRAR